MRGESLEPGGCSATPTSLLTRFTIACPAEPAGAVGVSVAPAALCNCVAKLVTVGVAGAVEGVGAGAACGFKKAWSCAMRARATSKLMHDSHRRRAAPPLAPL